MEKRRCEIYLNIFIIALVLIEPTGSCGIPLRMWLTVYYIIATFQASAYILNERLKVHPVYMHRNRMRSHLKTWLWVIGEVLVMSWLLYGNIIFFSAEAKDCSRISPMLNYFMLAVLVIGYFHFLIYVIVILIVAAVLYIRYKQKRVKLNNSI